MTYDEWLIFLGAVQIDLKRQIMTLDALIAEDDRRNPQYLGVLSLEDREEEIARRHARAERNYQRERWTPWTAQTKEEYDAEITQRPDGWT